MIQVPHAKGYRMISTLAVQNFRGLDGLTLSDLSRINVIVGPNASGKTALLEAIVLGCRGTSQGALPLWQSRSQSALVPGGGAGFRAVWSGFFPGLDMTRPVSVLYWASGKVRRGLRISQGALSPSVFGAEGGGVPPAPLASGNPSSPPLIFERTMGDGSTEHLRSYVGQQGQLVAEAGDFIGPSVALFPAFTPFNESDNVTWLSDLSLDNREDEVLSLLRKEFPGIEGLDVLTPSGVQGIFVSYKGSKSKLPIGLVSAGINKVLTLILASLAHSNGVMLIDEIENGIFYRRYTDVWALMRQLADERQNQIFLTTHSLECLRAALPVVEAHPGDFTLIRMERDKKGLIARQFSGIEFAAALDQDVDPRGSEFVFDADR
jgi:predicted ATPase